MPISHIHAVLLVLVLCIFADLKLFGNTGTSAAIGNWDKWRRLEEAGETRNIFITLRKLAHAIYREFLSFKN